MTLNTGIPAAGRGKGIAVVMLHAVLLNQSVMAEVTPTPGGLDSRIRSAPYDADQVYRVRGFVGYEVDFEFAPGESFVGLGAGDLEALSYFGQDNHLFLKPKAAKIATNLTILTNYRRYLIDYSATIRPAGVDDPNAIFAVRFLYPPAPLKDASETATGRIDAALRTGMSRRAQNIDYWYCGSPELKPIAASDDGVHTRLRFAAQSDLPAVFVRNADGTESLLNFSMDEGDVIVHRVAQRFVLRRGKSTGCIVNQGYAGGGLRLQSGTIAPDVERTVPGAVP